MPTKARAVMINGERHIQLTMPEMYAGKLAFVLDYSILWNAGNRWASELYDRLHTLVEIYSENTSAIGSLGLSPSKAVSQDTRKYQLARLLDRLPYGLAIELVASISSNYKEGNDER